MNPRQKAADNTTPAFVQARVPAELHDAIDAYAETFGISMSEALRRLVVQALDAQGMQLTITDALGTRVDDRWKQPIEDEEQQS